MGFVKLLALLISIFSSYPLFAIEFSKEEVQFYKFHSQQISKYTASCLNYTWYTHVGFFDRWRVSKYYGDRNRSYATREQRLKALERYGAPLYLIDELEAISCIGLTLKCLQSGFESVQSDTANRIWQRLNTYVRKNGVSGVHLLEGLQKLGWLIFYWNPAPENMEEWDLEDQKLLPGRPVSWNSGVVNENGQFIYHPGWGLHRLRYQDVMAKNKYYTLKVDNRQSLVGFGTEVPEFFGTAPLMIGIAHAGYHVFPGTYGEVIEAHSSRPLNSITNLERAMFNPLHKDGGPAWSRTEKYRSGVVALPPP